MAFSNNFFLLQQEGYLIRSCLTAGMTALRNASVEDKGAFYTAFFQLSIGFERLMKVILILDYMVSNQLQAPTQQEVKKYSHDLIKLINSVSIVAQRYDINIEEILSTQPTNFDILNFLGEFAKSTRYANLDTLSGKSGVADPLVEWNKIILSIIKSEIPKHVQEKVSREASFVENVLGEHATVIYHNLEKRPLSLSSGFSEVRFHNIVASYAVWHVMEIISVLKDVLVKITWAAQGLNQAQSPELTHIPFMNEFFNFVWVDKQWVMRKRRWP